MKSGYRVTVVVKCGEKTIRTVQEYIAGGTVSGCTLAKARANAQVFAVAAVRQRFERAGLYTGELTYTVRRY